MSAEARVSVDEKSMLLMVGLASLRTPRAHGRWTARSPARAARHQFVLHITVLHERDFLRANSFLVTAYLPSRARLEILCAGSSTRETLAGKTREPRRRPSRSPDQHAHNTVAMYWSTTLWDHGTAGRIGMTNTIPRYAAPTGRQPARKGCLR